MPQMNVASEWKRLWAKVLACSDFDYAINLNWLIGMCLTCDRKELKCAFLQWSCAKLDTECDEISEKHSSKQAACPFLEKNMWFVFHHHKRRISMVRASNHVCLNMRREEIRRRDFSCCCDKLKLCVKFQHFRFILNGFNFDSAFQK